MFATTDAPNARGMEDNMANIDGTGFGDYGITGSAEDDEIRGGGGDDVIFAGGGNDLVRGQYDDDILFGDDGEDDVRGGDGDDKLIGGNGGDDGAYDILLGGDGDDALYFSGEDQYDGGDGFDVFRAGEYRHTGGDYGVPDFLIGQGGLFGDQPIGPEGIHLDLEFGVAQRRGTGAATEDFYMRVTPSEAGGTGVPLGPGAGAAEFIQIEQYQLTDFGDYYAGDNTGDEVFGLDGDDIIEGRGGADAIDGGEGTDTLEFGSSSAGVHVNLTNGEGLGGDAEGDTYTGIENVRGSSHGDRITGDDADNTLNGYIGEDRLFGEDGRDTLNGGEDGDSLYGGRDDDTLNGEAANDRLYGLHGEDVLDGGLGADLMFGGTEDDTYYVNDADDIVFEVAREGTDIVYAAVSHTLADNVENLTLTGARLLLGRGASGTGNALDNVIIGNGLDNILRGLDGEDEVDGGRGGDTVDGGFGDDTLAGGDGVDTVSFEGWDPTTPLPNILESITITLGQGSTAGSAIWNLGTLRLETDSLSGFENVRGSDRGETIVGNAGANTLEGRGGADVLHGNAGSDRLDGGAGVDTASYQNNGGPVSVVLGQNGAAGQAQEFVILPNGQLALISVDTLLNIENVRGSASGDSITGNQLGNVLDGLAGADTMRGGEGSDTYVVDTAGDTIVESSGQGADTVRTSVTYALTAGADVEFLETNNSSATSDIHLTGNDSSTVIRANNGDNTIAGGGGNDTLTGLGGQDLFFFNTALDPVFNVDLITDFSLTDDTIMLENAVFTALAAPGGNLARNLTAAEFVVGTAAQDASDRIVYDSGSGALFYDSDGIGGAAAIRFATVNAGLALTAGDFLVV
jgi:Ca2+-binding RTX toxin-like protein